MAFCVFGHLPETDRQFLPVSYGHSYPSPANQRWFYPAQMYEQVYRTHIPPHSHLAILLF